MPRAGQQSITLKDSDFETIERLRKGVPFRVSSSEVVRRALEHYEECPRRSVEVET